MQYFSLHVERRQGRVKHVHTCVRIKYFRRPLIEPLPADVQQWMRYCNIISTTTVRVHVPTGGGGVEQVVETQIFCLSTYVNCPFPTL
jgi:hypothetical protein